MKKIKFGKYKNFKGKYYEVFEVALQTETKEKLILYKALYDCSDLKKEYGDNPIFARPEKNFFEKVEVNGQKVERFKFCGD